MNNTSQNINWHSAACSALKIEFSYPDDHNLAFYTEHLLNEKSRRIDMLIVKKDPQLSISNPLGSIFRTYNLIEYKSPRQSLDINAFYKTLSYAFSFKSMPYGSKFVSIDDISLTLISSHHPKLLFKHLRNRKISVEKSFRGVYHIHKGDFPIQVIVTKKLDPAEHIWLRCLTNSLTDPREARMLSDAYAPHLDEPEYSNLMNTIIRANRSARKGADTMCEALYELFAPQLKEQWDSGVESGKEQGIKLGENRGIKIGEKRGIKIGKNQGIKIGESQGKQLINQLGIALVKDQRSDEFLRSLEDPVLQESLLREYHLLTQG